MKTTPAVSGRDTRRACLLPLPARAPIDYAVPAAMALASRRFCPRSAEPTRGRCRRRLGRAGGCRRRIRSRTAACGRSSPPLPTPADARGCAGSSTGSPPIRSPARRGDAHGAERDLTRCEPPRRRPAGSLAGPGGTPELRLHRRRAPPRAGRLAEHAEPRTARNWPRRRRLARRWCAAWPMRADAARRCCRRASRFRRPDPDHPGPALSRGPGAGRRARCEARVAARAFARHPAGRRHRVRQDRGLFRGHRRMPARRAARRWCCCRRSRCRAQWLDRFARRFGVAAGAVAFRARPRAPGATPGARWRRARRRWWSAPARRCSCPSPISAWSWSTRSTRPPSSRRTAWSTTPATWRWCAPGCAQAARVLVSATPSLESLANVEAGRYAALHLPDPPRRRRPAGGRG